MCVIDFSRAVLYGIFHQEETPERTKPVKNALVQQFSENIKFKYSCFDRIILRGYIMSGHFRNTAEISFKNPMISRTMKNDALQLATQPSKIEEAYDHIHRGLFQLTQQLAINARA